MKPLLVSVALALLINGQAGISETPVPPPPLQMPEGHWEILAQQYDLIAILDEVIESEFAFAISAPNEPQYPTIQGRSEKFVISSIHRVTAKISRFLKVPDEIRDPIDDSEGRLSFYLTANVGWTEDLFDISEDALIAPVRLPCSGEILLIQMTHSPWHEGYSIAPYLNETVGGEHEQDIVEGIRTWNERSNKAPEATAKAAPHPKLTLEADP